MRMPLTYGSLPDASRDSAFLDRLEALATERPGLAALLTFHHRVLREQLAARDTLPGLPMPSSSTIQGRLSSGKPALDFPELETAMPLLPTLCLRLAAVLAEYLPNSGLDIQTDVDWLALARGWYETRAGLTLAREPNHEEVLQLVAGYGLAPFLEMAASSLSRELERLPWGRGYCPVCGGEPDLCALGDGAERLLLCGRCCALWRYRRVGCPRCDERDPARLAFHPAGDGPYRLYVCQSCRRYLKGIDLRVAGSEVSLPLERILTAGLDLAAASAGYQP